MFYAGSTRMLKSGELGAMALRYYSALPPSNADRKNKKKARKQRKSRDSGAAVVIPFV